MHFYSMGYREVFALPIRIFWTLSSNINRIEAERDGRQLRIAASAHAGKTAKDLFERLEREKGEVFEVRDTSKPQSASALANMLAKQDRELRGRDVKAKK